jgi:hypothetical protein
MNTTKLTRRIVLGIGIPAALATGAIAAAASSNGSPQSDKATTTITQTAPGTTEVVSVREPGEDVRSNADENELRGRANEPGEDIRGNADEAEHQNEAGDDNGNPGPGGGEDSNSGPGGGNDDGSGHDAGDDNGGSGHDGSGHGGDGGGDD